jgi:hypothetical protein
MPNPKQYLQKEIIPGNNLSWDTDGVTLNADAPSIEANPQGTPTDTLESLELDGTVYELAGGTEVEANPSDPATDTLSTIDIAGTVYNIEGGGGGGVSYDYYLQDGNIGGGPGSTAYATVPLEKSLTEGVYIAYTIDSNGTTGSSFFTWGGTNITLRTGSITYTLSETAATATDYSGSWRDIFLTIFKLNSGGGTGGGGFSAPDYENPETITLVLNTWVTYNVTENGYIMVDLTAFTETGGTSVKVNGTTLSFDKVAGTNYILNATYMFPVMKNDVVEIRLNYNSEGYGSNTALFFPAKNDGGGGGGGGSSTLVDLTDVNIDNPTEGQGLVYDATNQKWINGNVGGSGGYKETVLWEGSQSITRYDTPFTIPDIGMTELNKYDAFAFDFYNAYSIPRLGIMLTSHIKNHQDTDVTLAPNPTDSAYPLFMHYDSTNDILKAVATTSYGYTLTKVTGIKYGNSGNSGSSEVNYSTEEQRIGTWIDGSDLYQITYSYTSAVTSIDISSLNVNEVIELAGAYLSGSSWVPITRTSDNLNYQSAIWASSTTLEIWFGSRVPNVSKLYVTIKYTKTTD